MEDGALKNTVLKLLRKCNVLIDPSNVEDCNGLKSINNAFQKVIIKLSKRKDVYRILKAKSSFKNSDVTENGIPPNTPIFVNQSLCSDFKLLWSKCKKLLFKQSHKIILAIKRFLSVRLIDNLVKIISDIKDIRKFCFLGMQSWRKMLVVRNYSGSQYLVLKAAVVNLLALLKIRQYQAT